MPQKRIYLYVPFKDKNEVKKLGAMWDAKEEKWFAPKTLDKNIFSKWLQPQSNQNFNKNISFNQEDILIEFKKALEAQGLIIDGYPIMDNKIHRVKTITDKGRELSGAYAGYLDQYPAGFIQNFKTGYKENWKMANEINFKNSSHTPSNIPKQNNKSDERKNEILELQLKTAQRLENEFENARWANSNHPYLIKKGFNENFYLKQDKSGSLLIPLRDENGKLWSVQRIFANGDKIIGVIRTKEEKEQGIEYSARKTGCFHIVGAKNLSSCDEFFIAEGFATAATIYKAINKPVIMGVDAGNLSKIVETLNKITNDKDITIIADNDRKKELNGLKNTGIKTALEIKEKFTNVKVLIPKIADDEAKKGMSDFNDIFINKGLEEIKKQFNEFYFKNKLDKFSKNKEQEKTQNLNLER